MRDGQMSIRVSLKSTRGRDSRRGSLEFVARRGLQLPMADAHRTAERLFGDGALSVVLVGRPEGV